MSYELFNSQPDAEPALAAIQTETEEEYLVEVILKARYKLGEADDVTYTGSKKIPGHWEYWVKWAGYPDNENTWQSWESLVGNCSRLLKEFWDDFNFDELRTEDIMDGVVIASEEWIEFQKQYFDNHYTVTIEADDDPMVEENTNPQDEVGSSSEEEDEGDDGVDEDTASLARIRQHQALQIPPHSVTPELLDEQEFYFQNVYPSPMSIDNSDA